MITIVKSFFTYIFLKINTIAKMTLKGCCEMISISKEDYQRKTTYMF